MFRELPSLLSVFSLMFPERALLHAWELVFDLRTPVPLQTNSACWFPSRALSWSGATSNTFSTRTSGSLEQWLLTEIDSDDHSTAIDAANTCAINFSGVCLRPL